MSFSRPLVYIAVAAMMALVIGCSGGAPTSPGTLPGELNSLPIIASTSAGDASNAIGLLGAYELTLDPKTLDANLVPMRMTSAIGDSYLISGMGFFAVWPCGNCIQVAGVEATAEAQAMITFNIRHPFPAGDPTKPVSALNRLDLDIFDVALVVYPKGYNETDFYLKDCYVGIATGQSGFTSELEYLVRDNAAVPYYLVVDDSLTGTSTYNKFPMGGSGIVETIWMLSDKPLQLNLYLTFGYGHSALKHNRLTPTYFNPEFNRKNAWKVVVIPPEGSDPPAMGFTWDNEVFDVPYTVTVQVYDWQHGNTSILYPPVNPMDIAEASNVVEVEVEVPGMTHTIPSSTTPDSGTGTPSDPLIYTFAFPNENELGMGEYISLVKVTDERIPNTSWATNDFLIDSPDGVTLRNYVIPEFATYQSWIATVVNNCGPITGSITDPTCPITGKFDKQEVIFKTSASSASGGNPIVLFEVDRDYVGGVFTVDYTNTTGIFTVTLTNPNGPTGETYMEKVAFRATDSCVPPNRTVFATCDVEVQSYNCTSQELLYDWEPCTAVTSNCQYWAAGGCGLPNYDWYQYGAFKWGCSVGEPCDEIEAPYLTSGGDTYSGGCGYMTDSGAGADYNVVSPIITLPPSVTGKVEFDHCNAMGGGATFKVFISTNDCTGPWTEVWSTSTATGCFLNSKADISAYTSNTTRIRFQYYCSAARWDGGTCGNAGVLIDNVRIYGCFQGTLDDL